MKSSKRFLLKILPAFFLCLLTSYTVYAQGVINGRVINARTSAGVPNATVTVKGTNVATQTNADGAFFMRMPPGTNTLVITSVGFGRMEVAATDNMVASLTESAQGIEEVVVVAYGTRRKTDLTGSVTAVTAKDFQKGTIGSSEQLLQGKVAGLEVTTGGGAAGGGSKIRVRGNSSLYASNDPLIVIDGVPVESNGISGSGNLLNTINPNDIESMSVLKDASATALYGSRATNGVIIITTKKGTGRTPVFNFNTKASVSQINNQVDVLSAEQFRQVVNGSGNQKFIDMLGKGNTNWQDQIYRTALGWDNSMSVAGRAIVDEKFNLPYRISAGYYTQQGTLKTNQFDRYTTAINLSPKLFSDHLSFNINAKYAGTQYRFADEGAVGNALGFDPTQEVRTGANKFGGYYEWQSAGTINPLSNRNPVALLMLRNNQSAVGRFIGNIQADYKMHFLPDLHLLMNIGMDRSHGEGTDILDSTAGNSVNNWLSKGYRSQYEQTKTSKLADFQLFYEKSLGKSKVDVLVGHGYQEFFTDDVYFLTTFQDGSKDSRQELTFPDDRNGFAIESYLGRVNINLLDKLLLTGSIRRDASSKFVKENRVGYFPAAAAALKLKELLFSNTTAINDLKLRGSWGITGQQDGIDYYSYLPKYYLNNSGAYYQFGDSYYPTRRPSPYDPNVTWETTKTVNVGLDYAFAQNRINGTVDVYRKKTRDLLSVVPIAPGSNFSVELLQNVGNMENEGVEFAINLIPVRNSTVTWDLGFNMAANRYKITNLTKFEDPDFKGIPVSGIGGGTGNNIGKYAVGYAPFVYFPFQQVYDADGKPIDGMYEDRNRDGQINDEDRYYYKKPSADFLLGMSTNLTLGKFNIGAAGHGQIGNYLYNNYFANGGAINSILNPVLFLGNVSSNYLNTQFSNLRYLSDYYIENASFFRVDNINLGYNYGRIANDKASLRLSANLQNVFTITKYKGIDPEVAASSGVDNTMYPRPRIFSIGADINF